MTKRMRVGMVVAMLVAGMGLAAQDAQAQTITVVAQLSGQNETPTPVATGAFGIVTLSVDLATGIITFTGRAYNLSSSVTGSHLHAGSPGASGPVVLNFGLAPFSNDAGFSGSVNASAFTTRGEQGIRSAEDLLQALISGMLYFNIHTTVNPGGEIRGQACPVAGQQNPMTGLLMCTTPAGIQ